MWTKLEYWLNLLQWEEAGRTKRMSEIKAQHERLGAPGQVLAVHSCVQRLEMEKQEIMQRSERDRERSLIEQQNSIERDLITQEALNRGFIKAANVEYEEWRKVQDALEQAIARKGLQQVQEPQKPEVELGVRQPRKFRLEEE